MIADLIRIPGPPHDPRSILLNGRLGFRAVAPGAELAVAVDPECCVLTLPLLPGTERTLLEPSGSLGGIRPSSNVALGPDGSVYLLDRSGFSLKRFDPCDCRFVQVPCFGGPGRQARQLRGPGAITIACGNLYLTQRGMVSVFALKGMGLRGHLMPPKPQLPWRPVAVAVDSLGRAWVGDAAGKLHRFTPHGRWERAWPLKTAPLHIAIDCRDRVYLVSAQTVQVLDHEARPLPTFGTQPADLRGVFPRLPFLVDAAGNLWLEPLCAAPSVRPNPAGTLVFDPSGNLLAGLAAPVLAFEKQATYRTAPLDSGIAQCVWHRITLRGALPEGTRLRVRAFCADELISGQELDQLATWQDCAQADAFDDGDRWDCLLRASPGRYLSLEIELQGNGLATPAIGAIVVEFPRISLRRYLPAVFGADVTSADFTDRFLALFDTTLRSIERHVDDLAQLFDPAATPAEAPDPRKMDFLTWLGSWVGIAVDRNWDVAARRRLVKQAGALFDRRGTVRGLREQLLILLGFDRLAPCSTEARPCGRCLPRPPNCEPPAEPPTYARPPLVLEHFRLRRWLRVGAGRLGTESVVWSERIVGRTRLNAHGQLGVTRLDTSPDPERDPFLVHANQFTVFVPARCRSDERSRRGLENLIRTEAPAGTKGYLSYVEPRFRIGVQSTLGFDAVVGAIPQGVILGSTPLGSGSVLTTSPALQGGPVIALDKEGRIGTTTLLA